MTARTTAAPVLTDHDRRIITRARALAAVPPDGSDVPAAFAALGAAKDLLGQLADLAERLGGQ